MWGYILYIFFFNSELHVTFLVLHFTLLKETLHLQKYTIRNMQNYFDSSFLAMHLSISFSK